jgi:DNA-binding NtrC family response regulator
MVSETGSKPGRGARRTAALVVFSRAVPREVRGYVAGILEQSGLDVIGAEDEDEAIAVARKRRFAVAILDVELEGLRRFLAHGPRIRRVIVSPFALLERCTSLIRDELTSQVARLAVDTPLDATAVRESSEDDLRRARIAFENAHVRRVLERHGGDKARAAKALGIDISSLYRRLSQIERER